MKHKWTRVDWVMVPLMLLIGGTIGYFMPSALIAFVVCAPIGWAAAKVVNRYERRRRMN